MRWRSSSLPHRPRPFRRSRSGLWLPDRPFRPVVARYLPVAAARGRGFRSGADPSATSLITGLNSWWKLEEASGTRDDAQGSRDLTDNNTVTNATGKVGNAADFEASQSEYLSATDAVFGSPGDTDFTFAGWVQWESLPANHTGILGKYNGSLAGNHEFLLYRENPSNKPTWIVSGDGTAVTTAQWGSAVSTATWYFFEVYHNAAGNLISINLNNGTAVTTAHTTGVFNGTFAFMMGYYNAASTYHDGLVDEVGYWARLLTAAERSYLYNSGNGRTHSGGLIV